MLDVPELERRWSRYRLKRSLPPLIAVLVSAIAAATVSFFVYSEPQQIDAKTEIQESHSKKADSLAETNASVKAVAEVVLPLEEEQNVLKPSFTFMYNIEDQLINYNNAKVLESIAMTEKKSEEKAAPKKQEVVKKPKPKKEIKKTTAKPVKESRKSTVKAASENKGLPTVNDTSVNTVIIKGPDLSKEKAQPDEPLILIGHDQTSEEELKSVIKRFNQSKKPALSLFIAKKFYEEGNYQEAYNYALETNKLNPNIEESIFIFCQSLVKLGNKDEAIKALSAYIRQSGSTEAKILLNDIQIGKFK